MSKSTAAQQKARKEYVKKTGHTFDPEHIAKIRESWRKPMKHVVKPASGDEIIKSLGSNNVEVSYNWAFSKERHFAFVTFRTKRSAQRFLRRLEKLMKESAE